MNGLHLRLLLFGGMIQHLPSAARVASPTRRYDVTGAVQPALEPAEAYAACVALLAECLQLVAEMAQQVENIVFAAAAGGY